MTLYNFTKPYSNLEAWAYDRFVAAGPVRFFKEVFSKTGMNDVPQGAAVLDVGCGGGQIALALAETRPDLSITGLDLNADQVARAKRRSKQRGIEVSFVQGDALGMPFADRSFDAVYSIASIKLWPDQSRGLRECLRVLQPNGLLFVVEADRGCTLEDAGRFVEAVGVPRLFKPIALAAFRTWVAGRGIEIDENRKLLASIDAPNWTVERLQGAPALVITAKGG